MQQTSDGRPAGNTIALIAANSQDPADERPAKPGAKSHAKMDEPAEYLTGKNVGKT